MSPARRRAAVARLVRRFKVSERRACLVVGQHRSSQRYVPVASDFEVRLVAAMRVIADAHPRWGYRRVHAGLAADGWQVNVKRVERLWRAQGLQVPPRRKGAGQKALGSDEHALWALPALRVGHVWSYDFMSVRTERGVALRVLNIVDEYTRVCVGYDVDYSIGAAGVRKLLERVFAEHGRPEVIRSDNGREFIATSLLGWLCEQGVRPVQVAKASPQQNGFIERFNGSMRDELLHREVLHSLTEARVLIGQWVRHYNTERPHSGLQMRTPAAFARYCAEQAATTPVSRQPA